MILENGKYGKLIPVANHKLYIEALNNLLLKNNKNDSLIDHSLKFSVNSIAAQYMVVMKNVKNKIK